MVSQELLIGFGLFFVIEGLFYALAPGAVRQLAEQLPSFSDQSLRTGGAIAVAIGVAIVWLAKG